jgi:hypothetical protein
MRNKRDNEKSGDSDPTPTNNSYPLNVSIEAKAIKGSLPRQRRLSRPIWKAFVHGSEKSPKEPYYSTLSSSESNSEAMEKGYGDDFRRRATSPIKRGSLLSWNTQSAALFCCIVAPVAAFTIMSRGTFLRRWRAVSDPTHCGGFFETEAITALKSSSTLERLKNGVVASDQAICSKIGLAILRDYGGNAIDAAVATALCVGVVNPVSSGLGGGTFILIHSDSPAKTYDLPPFHDKRDGSSEAMSKNGVTTEVIDAREIAPAASTTDMFLNADENASVFGGLAPAVPGELRGLELAHARHGHLPWSKGKIVVRSLLFKLLRSTRSNNPLFVDFTQLSNQRWSWQEMECQCQPISPKKLRKLPPKLSFIQITHLVCERLSRRMTTGPTR